MKRFSLILMAVLSAISMLAQATSNKTFKRFYNLTPTEFNIQLNYYINHNHIDSAMLCANIQASKYGKEKLSKEGEEACCTAFSFMGNIYMQYYYNYQLATENYQKAEQIINKYDLEVLGAQIATEKAVLAATRNDLENNFAFNKQVEDYLKNAFYRTLKRIELENTNISKIIFETTTPNLLYFAIKFDRTYEVIKEIKEYRAAQKKYGTDCNIVEMLCNAIDYYNTGKYDKAFEVLQTPITHSSFLNDKDFIQILAMVKNTQYFVLFKGGKRTEALQLLLQQEQFLNANKMTFELLEVLQLIQQHYEMEGNATMSKEYSLRYFTTKDKFINKSRLSKMDEAKLNIELEQTQENVHEMVAKHREQTIMLWSAIIIALLVIVFLVISYSNNRKKLHSNRLLYEKQIALLQSNNNISESGPTQPTVSDKSEPTTEEKALMTKIRSLMETSPLVYNEGFGIADLADLIDSNTKYVSHVINDIMQCNFSTLLNEYRINEACKRLLDTEHYGHYTIESIANSVGYKSRTNFIAIFKNIVGLTPSAFQKMSKQNGNRQQL